jgi:tRNA A-37 threonylcarbamoyl transferase component Bud32
MAVVEINPAYRQLLDQRGLTDAARLADLPGAIISGHPDRHVRQVILDPGAGRMTCYLKRQHRVSWRQRMANALGGFGWISHARREARLLQDLRHSGVGCPDWIAAGEDDSGRAFLLLRGLNGTIDLRTYLRRQRHAPRRWRRGFARHLGETLAHLHDSGFEHHDLYAKHVLVDPHDASLHMVDWQRSSRSEFINWAKRCRDLAALHATLPDEVAGPRDRLVCLHAYLQATLMHHPDRAIRRKVSRWIDNLGRKLLRRRKLREQRYTLLPVGSQRLIWINGEALCVTPEFRAAVAGSFPSWLTTRITPLTANAASRVSVRLPGVAQALLIRRRSSSWLGWLWMKLRGRRFASPELKLLDLLFRLQRFGIRVPRVLGFGQSRSGFCQVDSFLLLEPPRDCQPVARWLSDNPPFSSDPPSRRQVLRDAGALLQRLHAAGCLLGDEQPAVQQSAGGRHRVVFASVEKLQVKGEVSPAEAGSDLLRFATSLPWGRCSRTDGLRLFLSWCNRPRLDREARSLARALLAGWRREA